MSHALIPHCSAFGILGNVHAAAPKLGGFIRLAASQCNSVQHLRQAQVERSSSVCHATAAPSGAIAYSVEDIMSSGRIITCTPDTTIDDALEILVSHHVTGLPVVDSEGVVVGVVSDFDLLALEGVTVAEKAEGLFPEAGADWNSFFEVQKLVEKNAGKNVGDVMTSDPICVRPSTSIEDAANLLLRMRIRRLPVVDERGRLMGIITRSNIIKAAWEARKAGFI